MVLSSFIITFRETLEAALVVGIILAYLIKIKKEKYNNIVYLGIVSAVIASIIGAFLFNMLAGGFTGRAEEIFEGIAMLFAAFLITFMIIWMLNQKHIVVDLHKKVDKEVGEHHRAGLFFLVFTSVFREGIETVIFLGAATFASAENNIVGALLGIIAAIILGYAMFIWSKKINIKVFFNVTSILLILFAAGLVAHGIHEFEEAKLLNPIIEHVWDVNPAAPLAEKGIYPSLHENGIVGSFLKGMFGYNGNPSLLEVLSYFGYLIVIFLVYRKIEGKNSIRA
ncbi:MAG: FTR1 family protein [Nanoarchaeota archaeon]|nr:FTR1 family protein [Nanoarchaeota archaeon]